VFPNLNSFVRATGLSINFYRYKGTCPHFIIRLKSHKSGSEAVKNFSFDVA